jgi:hypothetical protein
MGPATDNPTQDLDHQHQQDFKDHQESMFEESSISPGPPEAEFEPEQSFEDPEYDDAGYSLPDEAPDEDVMTESTPASEVPASVAPAGVAPASVAAAAAEHSEQAEQAGQASAAPANVVPAAAEPASPVHESPAQASTPTQQPQHAEPPAPSAESLSGLTIDDFAALEERILRAVNLVRHERQARQAAEERLLVLESQVLAQSPVLEKLQQEVEALRVEREQVRHRVERLLSQIDALEL